MTRPRLVIKPWLEVTRLLMTNYENEVLRAVLPRAPAHPRAAPTLLEGLSLWLGRPLYVVLCAADWDASSALGISDGFGFGTETVHYEVEVVDPGRRPRGLGRFRDLRRLASRGER
jgi:hypothetical protein